MSRVLFDYACECGHVFEELVDRDSPSPVKCPLCGQFETKRQIGSFTIDPRMGLDAASFPSMGAKWEKLRVQRRRAESRRMSQNEDY
jgi:putative FmdB family regulatory protein